jgi:hypothetical protein
MHAMSAPPNSEDLDHPCAPAWRRTIPCGEIAKRLRRRFAKAARNPRTGLKSMISGPFFVETLVGVGCRLMVLGQSWGTLAGTLAPMPLCAFQAHTLLP